MIFAAVVAWAAGQAAHAARQPLLRRKVRLLAAGP
ncbi:hypothetical protein FHX45_004509 [Amycolatopsis granulosa]|nr:hypothetical protein [Amycolatopsis granulosa]